MNGTSGFQEVWSTTSRLQAYRFLQEQRHQFGQVPGTFSALWSGHEWIRFFREILMQGRFSNAE